MERDVVKKTLNFKDTRVKIYVPVAMTTNLQKQNRKKKVLGRCWAKIGLKKPQPNVDSERRDSESSTDIDRQNQRLRRKISTGALVRGSDPPSGHSDKTAGDTWRAPAGRLIQIQLGTAG